MTDSSETPMTRPAAASGPEPADHLDSMMTDVALGVPKAESRTVRTKRDSELWDRMAEDAARARAAGLAVVYDIDV